MEVPMAHRSVRLLVPALLFAAIPFIPAAPRAQGPATQPDAGSTWAVPRTPDGHPDLQGHWTNDTYTPLERPKELGDKELFTREEAVAFVKSRVDQLLAQPRDDIHYDDAIWQAENYGKKENLRTSLIAEPRNGRLPPL